MKNLLLSGGLICCMSSLALAQEHKIALPNTPQSKVIIELPADGLTIEGYAGNEVIIKTSSEVKPAPERARGLRPIYNSAVDNSGIGLSVTKENGTVKIEKANRQPMKYTIRMPDKAALKYEQSNWMGGGEPVSVTNAEGDLEIKTNNRNVELVKVTGPVVVNTVSGEVKVVYSTLNQQKPTAIKTISGVIDVAMPAATRSNLSLRSISGEIYTDFDISRKSSNGLDKVGGGNDIESATNGGGVNLELNTVSGNIYIRKQK